MSTQLLNVILMCRRDGPMKCVGFGEIAEHPSHRLLPRELSRRGLRCPGCIGAPVRTGMQMRRIDFHTRPGHGPLLPAATSEKSLPTPNL
jgi:hypothetical protein